MANLLELKERLESIYQQIDDNKPPRVTCEDLEDISDNYQANLEYQWWVKDAYNEIDELEAQIKSLS